MKGPIDSAIVRRLRCEDAAPYDIFNSMPRLQPLLVRTKRNLIRDIDHNSYEY
jgi:hypothetical protein